MKTVIGRREYTVDIHKQEATQNTSYAKILESGLASFTFKAYARDVISRAALQESTARGAAQNARA